jgi:hypothetical protein
LTPHYPVKSPLAEVLRRVLPGSDEYVTEKYAFEIDLLLKGWGEALKTSVLDHSALAGLLDPSIETVPLTPVREIPLRSGFGIDAVRREFGSTVVQGREHFLTEIRGWLARVSTESKKSTACP